MAQSSPQAAIIPNTESSPVVAMFEIAIAMTGRLLALTTETQEAEVRSCAKRGLTEKRRFQVVSKGIGHAPTRNGKQDLVSLPEPRICTYLTHMAKRAEC